MNQKTDYYFKTFPDIAAFEAALFLFTRDSGCVSRLNEALRNGRFSYLVGDRTGVQLRKNDEKAWDVLFRKVKSDSLLWTEVQDIASDMLLPFIFSKSELDDKRKLTKKRASELIDRHGITDALWFVLCQRKPVDPKVIDYLKDELSDRIEDLMNRIDEEDPDEELSAENQAKLSALEDQNAKLKEELSAYKREKTRLAKKLAEVERAAERAKAEAAKSASLIDRKRKEIERKAEALKAEKLAVAEEKSKLQAEKLEIERTKGGYSARLFELERHCKNLEQAIEMKNKELARASTDLEKARRDYQELAMMIDLRETAMSQASIGDGPAESWTSQGLALDRPEFVKIVRLAIEGELSRLSNDDPTRSGLDDAGLAKRLVDLGEFLRLAVELTTQVPSSAEPLPLKKRSRTETPKVLPRTSGSAADIDPSAYRGALEKLNSLGRLRKILVDGNNLVLRTMRGSDFPAERNFVIDLLEAFSEEREIDLTVVFDSEKDPTVYTRGRVKVVFTGRGEPEADLRIEEELSFNGGPDVLVVSSDFAHVRPIAEDFQASFMTSEDFRLVLDGLAQEKAAHAR